MFYEDQKKKAEKKAGEAKGDKTIRIPLLGDFDLKELLIIGQKIAVSLVMIVVGVYMLAVDKPSENLCVAVSIIMIVLGVYNSVTYFRKEISEAFYQHNLLYGLIYFLFAYIVYVNRIIIEDFFPFIFAVIILINGFSKLQYAIDMKRVDLNMRRISESWMVVLIFSLIVLSLGMILLFVTSFSIKTRIILSGIGILIAGVTEIITVIAIDKKLNDFKEKTKRSGVNDSEVKYIEAEDIVDLENEEELDK